MDDLAAVREQHPGWRIWASDAGWNYATRAGLMAPRTGITVHGKTPEALSHAIDQAEADAARNMHARLATSDPQRQRTQQPASAREGSL